MIFYGQLMPDADEFAESEDDDAEYTPGSYWLPVVLAGKGPRRKGSKGRKGRSSKKGKGKYRRPKGGKRGRCHRCGSSSHWKANCPQRPRKFFRPPRTIYPH